MFLCNSLGNENQPKSFMPNNSSYKYKYIKNQKKEKKNTQ